MMPILRCERVKNNWGTVLFWVLNLRRDEANNKYLPINF